jgi:hypothetical protein
LNDVKLLEYAFRAGYSANEMDDQQELEDALELFLKIIPQPINSIQDRIINNGDHLI